MPSLIKTRTARTEDLPFLEGIIGQHWKINIDHQKELQNPQAILLVAEEENEEQSKRMIVGTALMWINDWNKTGYLGEIAVDKTMLRKRVGTQMIEQLAYRARENNLRSIIVETQLARREAMDFYLNRGFRMCGYNDRYYTNDPRSAEQIAIFFSLDL